MELYKVRAWVNKRIKIKGFMVGRLTHSYYSEHVYLKLNGAMIRFKNEVNNIQQYVGERGVESACVQLFIPHVFEEDGSLAYWPDNGQYIKEYEWPQAEDK